MADLPLDSHRSSRRGLTAVLLVLLLVLGAAFAQAPPEKPQDQNAASDASRRAEKKDHHISPAEAQELFRSVDTILKFDSDDTGLPIHHPVKRELTSRDQVEQYIRKQLDDDKETRRLRRSEAVLKKFGLLPRSYDLESLLISVLREQVAGYYDPKAQTFYLLDWIAPEEQKGVIAHELTHALQDQTIHLEKWLKDDDISDLSSKDLDKRDQKEQSISQDEVGTARQAVIEGQATAAFLDYFLSKAGRSIRSDPEQVYVFQQAMMDSGNTPVFRDAPLYMKEALAFPYKYGIAFEEQLLLNGGRKRAFEDALKDPPRTTRNIMEPKTYLEHEKVPPVRLPAMKPLLGDKYERFDLDSVGEFDVYVILKQFVSEGFADNISRQWRGGAYYAARKLDYQPPAPATAPASASNNENANAGTKPDDKDSDSRNTDAKVAANQATPPEALALMYVSRWATPQAAQKFADAYALALPKRYKDVSKAEPAAVPATFADRVASHTKWSTDEGPVFIESWGQYALVMEGFDDETAARVRDAFLAEKDPEAD